MRIRFILFLSVFILFESVQLSFAQKTRLAGMPAFVRELRKGPPPAELKYTDPKLYEHLIKRRSVLIGMLQKDVRDDRLPKDVLRVLNTPVEAPSNNVSRNANALTGTASGTGFHLTKDINQATNSYPDNSSNRYVDSFAVLKKSVYYAADDGVHGQELWCSNGTEAGTYMVKDMNPGSATGYPGNMTVFKNKLYFSAYASEAGPDLYQSDGTPGGTVLIKDLNGVPSQFTVVKNKLYFVVNGNYNTSQLWLSDGTTAGTRMVADLYLSDTTYDIAQLTAVNNILFFTAYSQNYKRELWRSNGTTQGTFMIKDINEYNDDYYYNEGPANLTPFNNQLYFSASDGSGRTLWVSDGTAVGTNKVPDYNGLSMVSTYSSSYGTHPFAIAQNSLFFAAYAYNTGMELYKYDPSKSVGITLVKDITPGGSGSAITTDGLRSMNDKIYFSLTDITGSNYSLWKSGGTAANTKMVKALPGYMNDYSFYSVDSSLYFSVNSPGKGLEPWISDGTAPGTKLLKDINTTGSSFPALFTSCNGNIFFRAFTGISGTELWLTKGNSETTKQVKDINTTSSASGVLFYNYYYDYDDAIPLDSQNLIFTANSPEFGYELWKSDGTTEGTNLITDLLPGEASSSPHLYAVKNGKAYFTAYDISTATYNMYVTDGSAAGTKRITILQDHIIDLHVADNGIVFYSKYDYSTGSNNRQLWRTDSVGTNYRLTTNIYDNFNVAGNICYFSGNSNYGYELWKSDGTISGTGLLADINSSGSSYPSEFTPLANKMIFTATNSNFAYSLYVSDGTPAGTFDLKRTFPDLDYYGSAVLNGKLYFAAMDNDAGTELFCTDGTVAGTKLIKDIYPGYTGSSPSHFTAVANSIYFTASDATHGNELWRLNTTISTVKMVKDIAPGSSHSSLSNLTGAGNKLYFIDSSMLWESNGTPLGTKKVSDPVLNDVTSIGHLIGVSNKLFFDASTPAYGSELYAGDASLDAGKLGNNVVAKKIVSTGLTAQLGVNPFYNDLKININSPQQQQLKLSIANAAGQQLVNKTIDVAEGTNTITLNGAQWPHGVYIVSISSSKAGIITLKAVK